MNDCDFMHKNDVSWNATDDETDDDGDENDRVDALASYGRICTFGVALLAFQ